MLSLKHVNEFQPHLFDWTPCFLIKSNAHARNHYGNLAEQIGCKALDLISIPIDGRYLTCFDAQDKNFYYEIKSVKVGGKLVIYDWRVEKEKQHSENLKYVIVVHKCKGARNSIELYDRYMDGLKIFVVDSKLIHELHYTNPIKHLHKKNSNPRNGYARKGYIDGYRNLNLKEIRGKCQKREDKTIFLYEKEISIEMHYQVV